MLFTRDEAQGMLLGLAIGDAVGTTVEFERRGTFPPVNDMVGGGPFGLQPGQWTDDTSMALCLADSLLSETGWNPIDCMDRFVRWWKEGENSCTGNCFDIGNTVKAALVRYLDTRHPYAGSVEPNTSGNGAIMRLAPAVIAYGSDREAAMAAAVLQSRTTHASPECELFAGRLADLLITGDLAAAPDAPNPDTDSKSIKSGGYVRETWEAAVWAVRRSRSFREAVLLAVNLGGDADTVGAVTGQIAGRVWGLNGIPHHWIARLAWKDRIVRLADELFDMEPAHALPLLPVRGHPG